MDELKSARHTFDFAVACIVSAEKTLVLAQQIDCEETKQIAIQIARKQSRSRSKATWLEKKKESEENLHNLQLAGNAPLPGWNRLFSKTPGAARATLLQPCGVHSLAS